MVISTSYQIPRILALKSAILTRGQYSYQVLFNFNNFSEKEIRDVTLHLVTYKSKDYKEFPNINNFTDFEINVLGRNSYPYTYNIPVGESNFLVNVSIYVNGNYSQCTDGSLDKPLYLLLFFRSLSSLIFPLER